MRPAPARWTAVAAALSFALAVVLQLARDRAFAAGQQEVDRLLYVRSPRVVQRLVLGFDALAADVYWIRAIQHYGGNRLAPESARRYDLLHPLLDLTTSLDPRFGIAYRFGAIFLSEPFPGGPGRPDLAIALLRKGIAAQPDRWHYYHDVGFVHYWALEDPRGAAEWLRLAARRPGAPNWLLPVAAGMMTEAADRDAARHLWRQMLQSDQDWLRRRAARGLQQIDALDEIERLTVSLRSGTLRDAPLDPAGVPYDVDATAGRIAVSRDSPLFPMPRMSRTTAR